MAKLDVHGASLGGRQPRLVAATADFCFTSGPRSRIIGGELMNLRNGDEMTITSDIERLRTSISGRVFAPGDEGWDAARQAWNLAVDQRPAAIAYAGGVDDVVATIEFARAGGLRIAAQATGHAAGTLGPLDDVVLLKTSRMNGVEVDPGARRARVGSGTLAGELAIPVAEHGLAPLAGSSPDVGLVGYSLGGGLGWLARRHGLASNSIRAIELVTAAGEPLRVDAEHEPDLFWAMRGGGGSFGVVTAVEFELYPADELYGGALVWPAEAGAEVLDHYRQWVADVPEALTSVVRYLNLPPFPQIPEPLRGRSVISIDAAYLGSAADGEELVRPLRAGDSAISDTFRLLATADLVRLHGDPEQPTPGLGDGHLLRELDAEGAKAFVEVAGPDSGTPLIGLELRHLGGALARPPEGHGALATLEGEFALFGVGAAISPDASEAIGAHLDRVSEAMEPWKSERRFFNFAERETDPADLYSAETYERLRRVRTAYDADGLFRATHAVPPAD
jgi:FAD/FMN-containing dehydrogenase